jgi:hypothetical protein
VLGAFAEADERDVGVFFAGELGDLVDVELLSDDLVAERAGDLGDGLGTLGALVGDQDAQVTVVALSHLGAPPWPAARTQGGARRGLLDGGLARSERVS